MEDIELLREYADHQSEPAFTELVERHVDLVFSTAARMVADEDLARDIVQTVFVDLARCAKQHSQITVVSGWLYRRTCFAALDLLRSNSSRREREKTAMEMFEANAPNHSVWQALAPHLEEAMQRLSPADQDAIVLRFIENKSLREVGLSLGLSEDTAQKRVSRALGRLRTFYLRQGITISLGVLASALASNALQAATPGLAASVTAVSVASAANANAGSAALGWPGLTWPKAAWISLTTTVLIGTAGYTGFRTWRATRPVGGASTNLVLNAGFEEGTAYWKSTKGLLSVTTALAHSGQSCARMSERSAPYAGPIQQLPLDSLEPGARFSCSAWIRVLQGATQPVQITIRYDEEEGTHYLTGARGRASANQWSQVAGEFVFHPAGVVTFVDLFFEGPVPGVDFLIDDVVLFRKP